MLEYVIIGLLVTILLVLVILGISLRRRETVAVDTTKLSEDISTRLREDVSRAVREAVSEVSERVGGVSTTLKSVAELFERIRKELPEDVKEPVKEVLERALRDLKEFDRNIAEMGDKLPNKVLKSIQSGINVRKGRVGEFTTLIRILADYKRIIPLGEPVDFIGISDEYIDFIEVKTGTSGLTRAEKEIKELIERKRVRFILKREEVEITTPGVLKTGLHDATATATATTENYDNELFAKLSRLRREIAIAERIEPFEVCHNSTLKEIAARKPQTMEELLLIRGITNGEMMRYGEKCLNVIRAHLSELGGE